MSDSLEVQVLRDALAAEQRKNCLLSVRVAELSAIAAHRELQLHNVTASAVTIVRGLWSQVARLQNDLAARN